MEGDAEFIFAILNVWCLWEIRLELPRESERLVGLRHSWAVWREWRTGVYSGE